MTDLERRTNIHLLDGQELMIAWVSGADRQVTAAATLEWLNDYRVLRGELEDYLPDEGDDSLDFPDDQPIPFTIVPGKN